MNATFSTFFEAVHQQQPFPWQSRLAAEVLETGVFPPLISLPTASGKTTLLDVAVYLLACDASLAPERRRAPLRTFFVIDRRIVVDDAARRAHHIASMLEQALRQEAQGTLPPTPHAHALLEVASALQSLARRGSPPESRAYQEARPLEVYVLRGGIPRELGLTRSPAQPLLCLSTVDQVGSRLLFRGYGVRDNSLPLHAALLAQDALVVLDEAHLSQPFEKLLQRIQRFQQWAEVKVGRPLQVVRMSATPQDTAQPPFRLDEKDLQHPVLAARLRAQKWVELLEVPDSEQDSTLRQRVVEVIEKLLKPRQHNLLQRPCANIGVVVNRVATARALFQQLRELAQSQPELKVEVTLLTGRTRPLDRSQVLDKLLPKLAAQRLRTVEHGLTQLVVATQCIEAGADLDFDALISECAPLDALRQRLGRLDRLGHRGQSTVVIFARTSQINGKKPDPIYGEALTETWRWLKTQSTPLDMGIEGLEQRLTQSPPSLQSLAPVRQAPVLLPMTLDLWCQTSPRPRVDPDPAPFLHGPERSSADVQLIWRDTLPDTLDACLEQLSLLPPCNLEALALPLPTARSWLQQKDSSQAQHIESALDQLTDQEGLTPSESEALPHPAQPATFLRWEGEDSHFITLDQLRPGDTLIIPATLGGLDLFGWHPQSESPVEDLAEVAQLQKTGRACLKLATAEAGTWRASLLPLGQQLRTAERREKRAALASVLATLRAWQDHEVTEHADFPPKPTHAPAWFWAQLKLLLQAPLTILPCGDGVVLRTTREVQPAQESSFTDEDNRSSDTGTGVSLRTHLLGVVRWTECHAHACGLPPALVGDLRRAALWHDLGKLDPRFQTLLYGGDEAAACRGEEPLAKSLRTVPAQHRRSPHVLFPPRGFRHEAFSVGLLTDHPALSETHDADLVLHLVGAHHGYARPFFPASVDENPQEVAFDLEGSHFEGSTAHELTHAGSGVAERFWRLIQRYGWYGLAYLETLLRLADHRRSEQEQEGDTP